jgi:hypothetical protein
MFSLPQCAQGAGCAIAPVGSNIDGHAVCAPGAHPEKLRFLRLRILPQKVIQSSQCSCLDASRLKKQLSLAYFLDGVSIRLLTEIESFLLALIQMNDEWACLLDQMG